jgi:hypothetical protein
VVEVAKLLENPRDVRSLEHTKIVGAQYIMPNEITPTNNVPSNNITNESSSNVNNSAQDDSNKSILNVGDFIYAEPYKGLIIYEKNKETYAIENITTTTEFHALNGTGQHYERTTAYWYHITLNGEKKVIGDISRYMIPTIFIDDVEISNFKIDENEIIKIESDEGQDSFIEGKGWISEFPDRCIIYWSDGTKTFGKIERMKGIKRYKISLQYENIPIAAPVIMPIAVIDTLNSTNIPIAVAKYEIIPIAKRVGGKRKSRRNRKSRQNRRKKSRQSRRR